LRKRPIFNFETLRPCLPAGRHSQGFPVTGNVISLLCCAPNLPHIARLAGHLPVKGEGIIRRESHEMKKRGPGDAGTSDERRVSI